MHFLPLSRICAPRPLSAITALLVSGALTACGGGGSAAESGASTASSASATVAASDSASTNAAADSPASAPALPVESMMAAQAEAAAAAATQAADAALQAENAAQSSTAAPVQPVDTTTTDTSASSNARATALASATATDAAATPILTFRARADLAAGVGAMVSVLVNGASVGTVEVKSTTLADYKVSAPGLTAGAKVEIAFTNDAVVNGADRNFYITYLTDGRTVVPSTANGVMIDRGTGSAAFDGLDVIKGQINIPWNAALRVTWPTNPVDTQWAGKVDAVRFLEQATFGPTMADVSALQNTSYADWITAQMALPYTADFVNYIQGKYALGDAYRPMGANYNYTWVGQKFWERAVNAPDQLRQRVAFALHQIFMISQADSNLQFQARAYANYADMLHKHAFGNFRDLLEDIALSPAMGIYLSHIRNRPEDLNIGRMPDENFAREIMQLFTIGLYELNADGTLHLDPYGNPIDNYSNDDVLAMSKVFTGWSWAFPDSQLTLTNFRFVTPSLSVANDTQIDLQRMKAYPGQHSTVQKKLFTGRHWAVTMPAGNSAEADLKAALDALFNHPNVGPFIGRQLIQHLVTSNPSQAYISRITAVFNNNGQGVRGDLGAVIRAILLDPEARTAPAANAGKLREPVLRVTHWIRAFGVKSANGEFPMPWLLDEQGERAYGSASVFSYFRPGYVPPNTNFSARGAYAPEFQIVNETTVASWLNMAEAMAGSGIAWNGSANDVVADYSAQAALAGSDNMAALLDQLNLLLLGGRMTPSLRAQLIDLMSQIPTGNVDGPLFRARAAIFLSLASPEFVFQP